MKNSRIALPKKPITRLVIVLFSLMTLSGLAGCGGSSGGGNVIVDPSSLTITSPVVDEGDTGTMVMTFSVTLSEAATETVTLNYVTSDGTATAGTDYVAGNGTITIPAGSVTASFDVTITGDTDIEADETLGVTIDGVQGVRLTQDSYTLQGTINNDDHADPAGFYNIGAATIKAPANVNIDLVVNDLQAMINGNRIMIMSNSNALLYDATITDIEGNDFNADVNIYHGMDIATQETPPTVISTTIQGTITEGSQISGTIAGSGIGSGNFSLTFSPTNSTQADIVNIDERWTGSINSVDQFALFEFEILNTGIVQVDGLDSPSAGLFDNCVMTGDVTPIANSTLFNLDLRITFGTCNIDIGTREGDHTGFITTKDSNHDTLVVMFTNGTVVGMAEWTVP